MSMSGRVPRPLFAGLSFAVLSFTGQAVERLPGAALGGLGVTGLHSRRREVGPRPGEPLLKIADLRLEPVLAAQRVRGGRGGRSHKPFGIGVLLAAAGRTFRRLPRQPLFRLRLPQRGGLGRRPGGPGAPAPRGGALRRAPGLSARSRRRSPLARPWRRPRRARRSPRRAAVGGSPAPRRRRARCRCVRRRGPLRARPRPLPYRPGPPSPAARRTLTTASPGSASRWRSPAATSGSATAAVSVSVTSARSDGGASGTPAAERAWLVSASTSAPRAADSSRSRGPCPACCAARSAVASSASLAARLGPSGPGD